MRVILALTLGLCVAGCTDEPAREQRTYNFHALSGVSMGAIGTFFLAGSGDNHRRLDAVAGLGGPMDAAYFLGSLERGPISGFCPRERLEALAASDPAALNDPAALDCTKAATPVFYENPQDFNHWRFTTNGGTFDRESYLEIFYDLGLALGNPFYDNESSPVFPPGVSSANFNAALCDHPVVLENFRSLEHNPDGTYPVISFCDGQAPAYYCDDAEKTPVDYCALGEGGTPQSFCTARGAALKTAGREGSRNPNLYFARMGVHQPCFKPTQPVPFGLAVDYNRNGRRDFHEPIVLNGHERFSDLGADGCANEKEDGKGGCTATGQAFDANHDDFDPVLNPLGFEGDFLHEAGEPYNDAGLDGVTATGDFGEGNGHYDDGPNRARFLATDFRQKYLRMSAQERRSIDVYADGGIRDVFNLGLSADVVTSAVRAFEPADSRRYVNFLDLPDATGTSWPGGFYNALLADYSTMGRNLFIRYGSDAPTEEFLRAGDGDHVGTAPQLVGRFGTFIKWMSARWTPPLGAAVPIRARGAREEKVFFSKTLNAPRNYGVALPPGYGDEVNRERRYPVLFLLHGYGMEAGGMSELNILFDSFMTQGEVREMIIVYPSGRCCYAKPDGSKDCREVDEENKPIDQRPGYVRECHSGNFFVNRAGFTPTDGTRYGDSLFELMDLIDAEYRVLAPMTIDVPREAP